MKLVKFGFALAIGIGLLGSPVQAQQKLVVSTWGGLWRDMIADTIGKKFTEETGVEVQYITGVTTDRLNKARLAKGNPESDIVFTTGHVGWLYVSGGLFEQLDYSKLKNFPDMLAEARVSPYHVGLWTYVYTIAFRPDLVPPELTFSSWRDLWDSRLKGKLAMPDFDPSHIMSVAAILGGGDLKTWEKGQPLLKQLKPNIKAFYSTGAVSQEKMLSGETPVQVVLSGNALDSIEQGHKNMKVVIPKEGGVVGFDTIAINKGTKKLDLAYKFIDVALSARAQEESVRYLKLGPLNSKAKVEPKYAEMPGIFTTAEQLKSQIIVDEKLRAEKLNEWKAWFNENIIAQ